MRYQSRSVMVVVLVLLGLVGLPVASSAGSSLKVTAREAVIHATPNIQSTPLARVKSGTLLEMIGKENDWYKVAVPAESRITQTGPSSGYIMARMVAVVEDGAAQGATASGATAKPGTTAATAQRRPAGRPVARRVPTRYRIYGEAAQQWFTASKTFDAVMGNSQGQFYGGGIDVIYRGKYFVQAGASHYRASGERVFVFNQEVFRLGISQDVKITPIVLNVGYRFAKPRRFVPYLGAGIGAYLYRERAGDSSTDDVSKNPVSYQVLGGVEVPINRSFAVAAELQYQGVPGIFGDAGVSGAFGEKDAGGTSVRVKLVFGM